MVVRRVDVVVIVLSCSRRRREGSSSSLGLVSSSRVGGERVGREGAKRSWNGADGLTSALLVLRLSSSGRGEAGAEAGGFRHLACR